jgi:peptidoglycan-associated lipoprotein
MLSRYLLLGAFAAATLALGACAHGPSQAQIGAMAPPGDDLHQTAANGADYGPGSQADLRRSAGSDKVFFALDSSLLDTRSQETLRRQAAWIAANPAKYLTVEGHCDERGTREYNIALGDRRASSAKNYLAMLGVSPARMSVVSYGKERPEAVGSDEQAYALNRRAVTVVAR